MELGRENNLGHSKLKAAALQPIVWGSDWPVMLLNADYPGWLAATRQIIAPHFATDQMAVMNDNAIRFYRLPMRPA